MIADIIANGRWFDLSKLEAYDSNCLLILQESEETNGRIEKGSVGSLSR